MKAPKTCKGCPALTGGNGLPYVCRYGVSITHVRKREFTAARFPLRAEPRPSGECPNPLAVRELAEAMGSRQTEGAT